MNNSVFILKDRSILYVNGSDAKNFLQNLISNDINKVNDSSSCFASLLTPQGKFLYEFIIVKHKLGFFIDCEKLSPIVKISFFSTIPLQYLSLIHI